MHVDSAFASEVSEPDSNLLRVLPNQPCYMVASGAPDSVACITAVRFLDGYKPVHGRLVVRRTLASAAQDSAMWTARCCHYYWTPVRCLDGLNPNVTTVWIRIQVVEFWNRFRDGEVIRRILTDLSTAWIKH